MITTLFTRLKSTSAKIEKEAILAEYQDNQVIQEVAQYTYDRIKYVYGVRKFTCHSNKIGYHTIEENWSEIKSVLRSLYSRKVTGGDAVELLESTAQDLKFKDREVFNSIIDRDWGCGISTSTMNKVWKDSITTFDVVLAKTFEGTTKQTSDLNNTDYYISRKLDGCRCIAINEGNCWSFWSRQGKAFTTLNKVANSLIEAGFPDGTVLDGEICLVDKNGNEDFQGIMKVIRKKDSQIENPSYKIFDILTIKEFYAKSSTRKLSERLSQLGTYTFRDHIAMTEQVLYNEDVFAEWNNKVQDNGWEGLMLRKDVGYVGKRSNDLLKVKKFFDDEYEIESLEFDKIKYLEYHVDNKVYINKSSMTKKQLKNCSKVNQEETMLKRVSISHKENEVGVGSGFTHGTRIASALNQGFTFPNKFEDITPIDLIGKTITVQYFELTKNVNGTESLKFPTLKHIYTEGRNT